MHRRLGLSLVLVFLCAAATPDAAPSEVDVSARLYALLRSHVHDAGPGAVAVVAKNGVIVGQGAMGAADIENNRPLTTHTVFDLASCSKQFTAMAIMILDERGKLAFEDDARKFLPELATHDPPIRVVDLLHMTSGLPDYEKLLDHLEDKSNLDVLHSVAGRPLLFPTGSKFNYCDTDYVLLAMIVERASHKPFAAFMKSEIFDPCGMKQSIVLERPGETVQGRAQGYAATKAGLRVSRRDTRTFGDGQVMAGALDLIQWDRALRENTLVKADMLRRAFTAGRLTDGKPCPYGFGWIVGNDVGGPFVAHGGGWAGTSTYVIRFLDNGLTIVVLSNIEKFPAKKIAAEAGTWFK